MKLFTEKKGFGKHDKKKSLKTLCVLWIKLYTDKQGFGNNDKKKHLFNLLFTDK